MPGQQTEEQRTRALTDAGYNPATFAAGDAPINRSVDTAATDTNAAAAEKFLGTFTAPQTAEQIAEQKRKDSQGLIDSINKGYDDKVATSKAAGVQRSNANNAVSVLSGLSGSTEAVRTDNNVSAANQKEIDAVNNQRALDLQGIYTKISADAQTEARNQLLDATANAKDVIARRTAAQTDAVNNLKLMASGGLVDFDAFKSSPENQHVYKYALDAVGGSEDSLKAIFALNRPQDQIVGTPTRVGDHFVQAYKNPLTGKVSYDTINLPGGIPPDYKSFQKIGDSKTGEFLYAIPDNWDGDKSKLKLVASTKGMGDGTNTNAPSTGDFAATIDLAANTGGTNAQRSQIKQTLQNFIANKDYASAYAQIAQSTKSGLKGTAATTFENQNVSLTVLDGLEKAIKAYTSAGGDMNVFKGTQDQIQTKIGTLMTDPKYASLATQLDSAFQQYRLNMTGAAFGAQESAEYASVLPSKGNTLDLNLAKLSGAKAYLNSSVEGAISSVVGKGGVYIKQYAEGATQGSGSAGARDLASQVASKGYDYEAMKKDGHSDADIKAALGL